MRTGGIDSPTVDKRDEITEKTMVAPIKGFGGFIYE